MKNSKHPKPALKWVGGKQRVLSTLLPYIDGTQRLIEPFVGAGSVFLAAGEREVVINDANADLIEFYRCLQQDVTALIEIAEPLFSASEMSPDSYGKNRNRFNSGARGFERAALLLYLNKFGFNGLYRVNKNGGFNVPYGHPKVMPGFPRQQLIDMAARLQNVEIMCGDFTAAIALATDGDVVYCDPPYVDTSGTPGSFTSYTAARFGMEQQQQLVTAAHAAAARGATVIISNHDSEVARQLYVGAEIHSFDVRRSISAKGDSRTDAQELIAVFRPPASPILSRSDGASEPERVAVVASTRICNSGTLAARPTYLDAFELADMLGMPSTKLLSTVKSAPWQLPAPVHFGSSLAILRWRESDVRLWMFETGFNRQS
jgi:DNA adenine methylase